MDAFFLGSLMICGLFDEIGNLNLKNILSVNPLKFLNIYWSIPRTFLISSNKKYWETSPGKKLLFESL